MSRILLNEKELNSKIDSFLRRKNKEMSTNRRHVIHLKDGKSLLIQM